MSPHTVKAFDDDLDQLRATISEMGGLAEDAITESMRALVQRDTETAFRIMERGQAYRRARGAGGSRRRQAHRAARAHGG
jgi:hypothetical protein